MGVGLDGQKMERKYMRNILKVEMKNSLPGLLLHENHTTTVQKYN